MQKIYTVPELENWSMIRLYSIQEEPDPRSNIYEDGDGGNTHGTNDAISK